MSQVSVGQVENLEDAIATLETTCQRLQSECQAKLQMVAAKVSETRKEVRNCFRMLEEACQAQLEKGQALEQAQAQLVNAQENFSAAHAALSACRASGICKAESNYGKPPNCSGEVSNVSAAEASMIYAQRIVATAAIELEQAKNHRMQVEKRNELARQCLSMAIELDEIMQTECAESLDKVASLLETGIFRLEQAKSALDDYLATNPPAALFYSWLKWSQKNNVPVTAAGLNARLNTSAEQHHLLMEYLTDRDPSFRARIADRMQEPERKMAPQGGMLLGLKPLANDRTTR